MTATTLGAQISALEADRDGWRQNAQEAALILADVMEQKQELEVAAKVAIETMPKIKARGLELIADRDRARDIAVALEQECAAKDARIAEALGYLTDALVWCNSDNTADCISEAIAALMGDES